MRPKETQCCYICYQDSAHGQTCQDCKTNPRTLDGLIVSTHYDGNPILKQAIHSLKYEKHPKDIVFHLANLLYHSTSSHSILQTPHSLLPTPLHPKRLKKRGYNQTSLLAHSLNTFFDQNIKIDEKLLTRPKETSSQVNVSSRSDRLKNLEAAFKVTKEIDPHKTYILIDDVCTTGATLEECCSTLRKAGAQQVWGLVLARN